MTNSVKISLFIILCISLLFSYRVDRKFTLLMDELIFVHNHTPSKSVKRIRSLEDRVYKLEHPPR